MNHKRWILLKILEERRKEEEFLTDNFLKESLFDFLI